MENLKEIRNELLKLHKILMDIERGNYEAEFGKVSNLQFLNLLFEHRNFVWLREMSGLVAQIDELYASKKALDVELEKELFLKAKSLFDESDENEDFKAKYQANLDTESLVSDRHERLIYLFTTEKA